MSISCISNLSIGLPRHLLWELITDPAARQLWQPNVVSTEVIAGYGAGKGCVLLLKIHDGEKTIEVRERVLRSKIQESVSVVQQWPKHQIQNKYSFRAEIEGTTLLTLQMLYKRQQGIVFLGKQMTRAQLEAASEEELLSIKNLSTQLHNRMADHSMPRESTL